MTEALKVKVRTHRSNALLLSGMTSFAVGAFVLAPWLGFMVSGVLMGVIGWVVDE